jgi:hypothetical protein
VSWRCIFTKLGLHQGRMIVGYIIKIMRLDSVGGVHSKRGRDKSPILLESKEDEEWRTVSLI